MILSKLDLKEYLESDKKSLGRVGKSPTVSDWIWRFEILLRKYEYYYNTKSLMRYFYGILFRNVSLRLGFTIPINVCDKGLAIVHYGTIVISDGATIGENCRIHEGVCIGATNGEKKAASIGKNVFVATGAKIIGQVNIADNVAIAANAVVVQDIDEPGTTWGGVPAKKISDKGSEPNMLRMIKI